MNHKRFVVGEVVIIFFLVIALILRCQPEVSAGRNNNYPIVLTAVPKDVVTATAATGTPDKRILEAGFQKTMVPAWVPSEISLEETDQTPVYVTPSALGCQAGGYGPDCQMGNPACEPGCGCVSISSDTQAGVCVRSP